MYGDELYPVLFWVLCGIFLTLQAPNITQNTKLDVGLLYSHCQSPDIYMHRTILHYDKSCLKVNVSI